MNELNELAPSLRIQRLGLAVMIIDRGEYVRALRMREGSLKSMADEEIKAVLEEGLKAQETEEATLKHLPVIGTRFFGSEHPRIGYTIDSSSLLMERRQATRAIDEMNGFRYPWRDYNPHVSVASVAYSDASSDLLQAFDAAKPHFINLSPIKIKGEPLR